MSPWQWHIHQLNHQKTKVCVVNLFAAIFGDEGIKGFREKGERNTGIKNCV